MILFSLLYVLIVGLQAYSPEITTESDVQKLSDGRRYIEISSGSNIELHCSQQLADDINEYEFVMPNLSMHSGYTMEDFESRITVHDKGDRWTMKMKNAKVSDTGEYSCEMKNDESFFDSIYIFVSDDTNFFVPLVLGGSHVSEPEFIVPCQTTKYVEDGKVNLRLNGDLLKAKTYDPMVGFKVSKKSLPKKDSGQSFQCVTDDESQSSKLFLVFLKNEAQNDSDMTLTMDSVNWTYVGGPFTVACVLTNNVGKLQNKYLHSLNIDCPRCGSVLKPTYKPGSDSITVEITTETAVAEDNGKYTCSWELETNGKKELKGTREIDLEVSPKQGQFKEVEVTPRVLEIKVGGKINLVADVSVFPLDKPGYHANWMRKIIRPPNTNGETEFLVSDNDYEVLSEKTTPGRVREMINIKNARVNMSGLYILTIQVLDSVKTFEWEITVSGASISARIDVISADPWVISNQTFYPTGTSVRVGCVVQSLPLPTVTLSTRVRSQGLVPVPEAEIQVLDGTFEKGLFWNTTLQESIDVVCKGNIPDKLPIERTRRLRVSDGKPNVTMTLSKSPQATLNEDDQFIYEGDEVRLICTIPLHEDWEINWMFKDKIIPNAKTIISANSKQLMARLTNIAASSSGKYFCVETNNSLASEKMTIDLDIKRTKRPFRTSDEPRPFTFQYGEEASFECHLSGTPEPLYLWYKDGKQYPKADGKNLTIKRIVAEDQGEFICNANNRAGYESYRIQVKVEGVPERLTIWTVLLILVIIVVLLAVAAAATTAWLKGRKVNQEQGRALHYLYEEMMKNQEAPPQLPEGVKLPPINERVETLGYDRKFELDREQLELGKVIGNGQFGLVRLGYLTKPKRVSDAIADRQKLPIAVKSPKNGMSAEQQKMLASEMQVMCAIGKHPNVLCIIGAITKNMKGGELYVVVELCDHDSLNNYLRKNRTKYMNELKPAEPRPNDGYIPPVSVTRSRYAAEENDDWAGEMQSDRLLPNSDLLATSDLISFSMQVANGMEYLASIPCFHRDLAARNILVTSDRTIRIADFGLARQNDKQKYYRLKKSKHLPLPVRWMAIESIRDGLYSEKSDVWSFGILLYEIFTLGGMPFPTLSNEELLDKLMEGYKMTQPRYAHEDIYELMLRCWETKPSDRPTFSTCLHFLKEHLKLASKELLDRVELNLMKDYENQMAFSQYLPSQQQDEDIPSTSNGLVQSSHSPNSTANRTRENQSSSSSERIYMPEFPK